MTSGQSPIDADAAYLRIPVVVSRYHESVTRALRDGAVRRFVASGGKPDDLNIIEVAGAFELPAVCRALAVRDDVNAIVTIGCVITGETPHDQYICQAVVQGLMAITVDTGVPIAFGVLTCNSLDQARARAGGERGNKGEEAMGAAIQSARTIRSLLQPDTAERH